VLPAKHTFLSRRRVFNGLANALPNPNDKKFPL